MPEQKLTSEEEMCRIWVDLHRTLGDSINQRPTIKAFGRYIQNKTLETAASITDIEHGKTMQATTEIITRRITTKIRSLIQKEGEPDANPKAD